MKRKIPIIAMVAVLVTILAVPMAIDEGYAVNETELPNNGEITVIYGYKPANEVDNPIILNAGGETKIKVVIRNESTDPWLHVGVNAKGSDSVGPLEDSDRYIGDLGPETTRNINLTFVTDRYTSEGTEEVHIELFYMIGSSKYIISENIVFNIQSDLSSAGHFNKIMGVWPNTLPEPFNGHLVSTLITFAIWVLISFIGVFILRTALHIPIQRSEILKEFNMSTIYRMVFSFVLVFGLYESLKVFGASEHAIDLFGTITAILYIVLGTIIVWEVYKISIRKILSSRNKELTIEGVDDTLIPLFELMGKITIASVAVAAIFSALGADLMGIVAGAGIAGLAISLGAQNMLKQFFSGVSLLTTRPFKEGDHIRLDGGDELKVHKVGIMNTWFRNPWNEEIITLPNNRVADSTITNLTGETLRYRFNFFVEVTRDADLELVKKILTDAAMDRPEIITDGSISMPYARATGFTDSGIRVRLSAYVHVYDTKWATEAAIMERTLKEFRENGIRLAYKRLDVRTEPRGTDEYDL